MFCFFWSTSFFQADSLGFLDRGALGVSGKCSSGLLRVGTFLVGLQGGIVGGLMGFGGVDRCIVAVGEDLSPWRRVNLVVGVADSGWEGRLRIDFGMYW